MRWRMGRDIGGNWVVGREGAKAGANRMEKRSNIDDSMLLERRKQEKSRTVESKGEEGEMEGNGRGLRAEGE